MAKSKKKAAKKTAAKKIVKQPAKKVAKKRPTKKKSIAKKASTTKRKRSSTTGTVNEALVIAASMLPSGDEYLDGIMNRTGHGYSRSTVDDSEIDNVDYYNGTECAEDIEAHGWQVNGYKAIAYLYLFRVGKKPGNSAEKDLRKTEWYLTRLAKIEGPSILQDDEYIQLCELLEQYAQEHGVELASDRTEEKVLVDDPGDGGFVPEDGFGETGFEDGEFPF